MMDGTKQCVKNLDALRTNHNRKLLPTETRMHVIGSKWIFKTKLRMGGCSKKPEIGDASGSFFFFFVVVLGIHGQEPSKLLCPD